MNFKGRFLHRITCHSKIKRHIFLADKRLNLNEMEMTENILSLSKNRKLCYINLYSSGYVSYNVADMKWQHLISATLSKLARKLKRVRQ